MKKNKTKKTSWQCELELSTNSVQNEVNEAIQTKGYWKDAYNFQKTADCQPQEEVTLNII